MRGDLKGPWIVLAGDFPPTLNKEDDPAKLKIGESPACTGISCASSYVLRTGSVPLGTDRSAVTKTFGGYTWQWMYNRVWRSSGSTLYYGAPEYADKYVAQGLGNLTADAAIVTFMQAFENAVWIVTATGSHIITQTEDARGWYELRKLYQEMSSSTAANCLTLNGIPFVCNANGVFSFDGDTLKEWTRPIRNTLGSFADVAIKADYAKGWIIGTNKFVLDAGNGKLYDYGAGFSYATRTLVQNANWGPFSVDRLAFILEWGSGGDATVGYDLKLEERDWAPQDDISIIYESGSQTRVEVPITADLRTAHRFQLRLTSLSSNLYIREIQACVTNYAPESFGE